MEPPAKLCLLLLGLTFLRCVGADWNATAKSDVKGILCIAEKENCTDGFETSKQKSHFIRCPKEYKHYCIKGKCRYVVDVKTPSCVCESGYVGSRCELLDLYYLRGDHGQLVVIGLIAAMVAVIALIICACAVSHHCRNRRKQKKKVEEIETSNKEVAANFDTAESSVAFSVSIVDETGQNISLNERKSRTMRDQEHFVD